MSFQLHLPLQLVGGVGRSFVARLLSECPLLFEPTRPPLLFDADPWGGCAFKGKLSRKPFCDLAFGDHVDQSLLDDVVEQMRSADQTAILDPGGAVVRDVAEYFLEPVHAETIDELGQMVAHFIVVGGARQQTTATSAFELAQVLPTTARVVVWRNEFFDEIDRDALEPWLTSFPRRIDAILDLPHQTMDLARDLHELVSSEFSIDEALASAKVTRMAAYRLLAFREYLVATLSRVVQPTMDRLAARVLDRRLI